MISLKKYLESSQMGSGEEREAAEGNLLPVVVDAYGSALIEMGNCSLDACPGMGSDLKRNLSDLKTRLSPEMNCESLAATDVGVREQLREWGRGTGRHLQQKACEVKEMLLAMARTAESVGARVERCAGQMNEVTERLKAIASLEDLTEIRASIEKSASELKSSIDRMTADGRAVLNQLKEQVASYQTKLEEAEQIASRDALTGLSSRLFVECQIERRMGSGAPFCVAIIDIDRFKKVNDDYGHVTGDDLLKQFSGEVRSACRATNVIGR
jgi:diguanylate cyclase